MKLKDYLAKNGVSQTDFAHKIGRAQATVSRLCSGALTPSLSLAIQIERATGGSVDAASWLNDRSQNGKAA